MKSKKLFYRMIVAVLSLTMSLSLYSNVVAVVDADQAIDFSRYDAIYEEANERFMVDKISLETIYEKYGDMNGDYYRIALEEVILLLDGKVAGLHTNIVSSQLMQTGKISKDIRKSLREAVAKYGLDESLIPDDPDFIDKTAETPKPTWQPSTSSEVDPFDGTDGSFDGTPLTYDPTKVPTPANESKYADVTPDDWYYEAVVALSEGGLFLGYDDGLFHPDDNITYGQWATVMSRVAIDNYTATQTPDMHWAEAAYSRTSRDGICEGPNSKLGETLDSLYNRGQALDSSYRLAHGDKRGLETRLAAAYTGKVWTFDDIPDGELVQQRYVWYSGEIKGGVLANSTGRWNDTWVLGAYNLGITHGVDAAGTCNPTAPITRAEVAQLLYNMGITQEKQCDLRIGGIGS